MKKLFTFLLLCVVNVLFSQEGVLLRFKYKVGDSYLLKFQMHQDMGAMMNMDTNMNILYDVESVKDTIYGLKLRTTQVETKIVALGETMNYNSSMEESSMTSDQKDMHKTMKELLTSVVTSKCTDRGEMFDFKVVEGKSNSTMFEQQTDGVVYPKAPVKVGDSWEEVKKKDDKGLVMNYVYTVKAIGEKTIDVVISGTLTGMMTGDISGMMTIDKATGTTPITNIKMDVSMMGRKLETTVNATFEKQ